MIIAVVGCAMVREQPPTLYETFEGYRDAVASGTVVAWRKEFFTPAALKDIDINSKSDVIELSVASYMAKERSHYEKVEKMKGCLTVNGYQENGDPVSLFIEYKPVGDHWLMSYTNVHLPQKDGLKGFHEKALCPDEAQDKVMREFK